MDKELQLIIDNLDFTGTKSSYFDNWSTEFDWDGEGNKSREKRKDYLKLMLQFFNEAKVRLKKYPRDYQLWIEIDPTDSSKDAVFIHTPNPNNSTFPNHHQGKKGLKTKDNTIGEFVTKSKLEVYEGTKNGGNVIFLFDPKVGIPPIS
jgi:hypothetical protein